MSGSNYLGRAGAYAMHRKYPSGSQTAAQLAAQRANLIKARQARGQYHHTKSATYKGMRKSTVKSRGNAAAGRAFKHHDIFFEKGKNRALGIKYMQFYKKARLKKLRITGINKRFRSRIGPSRYKGRTTWGANRRPAFKKHLGRRHRRFRSQSRWRGRGKRFTPR